jgi:polysaccharide pyruvyl transferase WcaK-like protein
MAHDTKTKQSLAKKLKGIKPFIRVMLTVSTRLFLLRLLSRFSLTQHQQDKVLLFPADANSLLGSLGDVAMMTSVINAIKANSASTQVCIAGYKDEDIDMPGVGPMRVIGVFNKTHGITNFHRALLETKGVVIFGADIMDGHYDPGFVCHLIALANHASRCNVSVSILGFSFNKSPHPSVLHAFSTLKKNIAVFIRSKPSRQRFSQLTKCQSDLVADVAFLLRPSHPGDAVLTWIKQQREKNGLVVGLNVNLHAFVRLTNNIDQFVEQFIDYLPATIDQRPVSYLFIPHDFKKKSGDVTLAEIFTAKYAATFANRAWCFKTNNPAEAKGLMSHLDCLLTGRMHLAIAALGVGTPTVGIAYQDKFEGLFMHFGLSGKGLLLTPDECLSEKLNSTLCKAWNQHEEIRQIIASKLPTVLTLSKKNLDPLLNCLI